AWTAPSPRPRQGPAGADVACVEPTWTLLHLGRPALEAQPTAPVRSKSQPACDLAAAVGRCQRRHLTGECRAVHGRLPAGAIGQRNRHCDAAGAVRVGRCRLGLRVVCTGRSLPTMAKNEDVEQESEAGAPTPAWLPYTRSGDDGETSLGDFSRTDKANPRIAAYGACEEAAAFLGYTINSGTGLTSDMVRLLTRVQNDLIDVAADICTPMTGHDTHDVRISRVYVA